MGIGTLHPLRVNHFLHAHNPIRRPTRSPPRRVVSLDAVRAGFDTSSPHHSRLPCSSTLRLRSGQVCSHHLRYHAPQRGNVELMVVRLTHFIVHSVSAAVILRFSQHSPEGEALVVCIVRRQLYSEMESAFARGGNLGRPNQQRSLRARSYALVNYTFV